MTSVKAAPREATQYHSVTLLPGWTCSSTEGRGVLSNNGFQSVSVTTVMVLDGKGGFIVHA